MRLFVAIEIPNEIRSALALFVKELRGTAPLAKWVGAENLHVTLKFLGHADASMLEQIKNTLTTIRSPQPVTLEFQGLGFFPDGKRPRVFWAGIESPDNLPSLAAGIDRAMHQLGFSLEDWPFTPHLTLARFDPPGLPTDLAKAVTQNASRAFGSFTPREFHLIESKLKSTGPEYTTVQSFPFMAGTQR